jgi:hypothetical protein
MSNVDWVTKRSNCSLLKMFQTLKLEVEKDVEIRKSVRREGEGIDFQFAQHGDSFSVSREGNSRELFTTVTFQLTENTIHVDQSGRAFIVKIMLNNDGDCKFKINEQEYESWQVRRKLLEPIFFEVT